MLGTPFYLIERMAAQRIEEEHRQAEARRLAREAMAGRQGWLLQQRGWVLGQVGRWLESLVRPRQHYRRLQPTHGSSKSTE